MRTKLKPKDKIKQLELEISIWKWYAEQIIINHNVQTKRLLKKGNWLDLVKDSDIADECFDCAMSGVKLTFKVQQMLDELRGKKD